MNSRDSFWNRLVESLGPLDLRELNEFQIGVQIEKEPKKPVQSARCPNSELSKATFKFLKLKELFRTGLAIAILALLTSAFCITNNLHTKNIDYLEGNSEHFSDFDSKIWDDRKPYFRPEDPDEFGRVVSGSAVLYTESVVVKDLETNQTRLIECTIEQGFVIKYASKNHNFDKNLVMDGRLVDLPELKFTYIHDEHPPFENGSLKKSPVYMWPDGAFENAESEAEKINLKLVKTKNSPLTNFVSGIQNAATQQELIVAIANDVLRDRGLTTDRYTMPIYKGDKPIREPRTNEFDSTRIKQILSKP